MTGEIYQLAGVEAIARALADGADVQLVLAREDVRTPGLDALLARARAAGVAVRTATERVVTRLCASEPPAPVLALVGRDPGADLDALVGSAGALWLLVGVAYPGNAGMVIRTAEVSGARGIVIDGRFDGEGRKAALRASMRADRFMPVHWCPAAELLDRAAARGLRVLAVDEAGDRAPWDVDLRGPCVFVVGGENGGIPPDVRARCAGALRVPMAGFIPCYNLQAAVSAVATERLRQLSGPAAAPR